jgi:hypothetical protein
MPGPTLEHVLQEIASLTPDERQQLRQYLESESPKMRPEAASHAALHQQLLREAVLTQAPKRVTDPSAHATRRPIPIKGKPLSRTILEERR